MCLTFEGIKYCSCSEGKDDFGIETFHFGYNSALDIGLREFVHYNKTAFIYKCKVDIILSKSLNL